MPDETRYSAKPGSSGVGSGREVIGRDDARGAGFAGVGAGGRPVSVGFGSSSTVRSTRIAGGGGSGAGVKLRSLPRANGCVGRSRPSGDWVPFAKRGCDSGRRKRPAAAAGAGSFVA